MPYDARLAHFIDKVFLGDILELIRALPEGSVDMVYADPDYNVGVKYNETGYRRRFDEYLAWCVAWAAESLRVLKETGNLFIINYPRNNSYLWTTYLDDACYDVHEYVWCYNSNIGHSPRRFTTAHRSILHCRKCARNVFYKESVAEPYQNPTDRRIRANLARGSKGRMPYSWLYYDLVKNVSRSKTVHACQIPEGLSEKLVRSTTLVGDVVLVLFGGSGSELVVCKRLGRHFMSAEIDANYHKMILERLRTPEKVPDDMRLLARIRERRRKARMREMLPFRWDDTAG